MSDNAVARGDILTEASRRRTFAIISHPDAGKTTLTEKFLLYSGVVAGAGSVRAKGEGTKTSSDWMAIEQQRGISISSTVMRFPYRDELLNLLDTPGHKDFSEDTFRVLAATDAAIMVLDAAKGIEPQTRRLFEVCRERDVPIVAFINKWDRPGLDPFALLDEIEEQLVLEPAPVTWPVGQAGDFRGVINRPTGEFVRYTRTARGATIAPEEVLSPDVAAAQEGQAWQDALEGVELLDGVGRDYDQKRFEGGDLAPVFFGSALTNFGVSKLLDAVVDIVPAPSPRRDIDGAPRPLDAPFSGVVFKVQANTNKAHRDRIAFLRVCSGRFDRGMSVTHGRTGRSLTTKYAHSVQGQDRETVEEAFPGDVIGLVNAQGFTAGDSVYVDEAVRWKPMPAFAPSLFSSARPADVSRFKQFRAGIAQLDEEGVVQVLRREGIGDQAPLFAAVGQLQFEVAKQRMDDEYGAPVELTSTPFVAARITDRGGQEALRSVRGVEVVERADGTLLALFETVFRIGQIVEEFPDVCLERMMADETTGGWARP